MPEQYTPNVGDLYLAWSACRDDYSISATDADSELDRLLTQVRRDAAREALGAFAGEFEGSTIAHLARIYRDERYPKGGPDA